MKKQFYIMRHCQSVANADGLRCGGDWETDLSQRGRVDAKTVAVKLAMLEHPPGVILVAPLARTRQTAEIVNGALNVGTIEIEGLRERFLGKWNGASVEDTEADLRAGKTPPEGEPSDQFKSRILKALDDVVSRLDDRPLVIGSRGTLRVILEYLTYRKNVVVEPGTMLAVELDPDAPLAARAKLHEVVLIGAFETSQ